MRNFRHLLAALLCLVSLQATAHWQWLDKDGRKVFSDRAPPPDIAEKDILARPAVQPAASAPQNGASAPRLGGVDKELTDKKKKAEELELARRRAEGEKLSTTKADNCARAKRAKTNLDSGRPIGRSNEKGEPEMLDAAARAAELSRIQDIIEADCN
ncbi:MAG: DUF4124 domain-containing protein [Comamonadaceae bacterium]|nr:DUF4124 domain-containing protein [Rhodoferax sp.]TSA11806.1 MAG: DUF4124 domain-containing protein [Comamonadaceae bacterium]